MNRRLTQTGRDGMREAPQQIACLKSLWSQCPSASCNEFTSTLNNGDNERVERAVGDGGEIGERERVEEEGKCVKETQERKRQAETASAS